MNLQQIKSQASLGEKILIEKVENLIRSEYNKEEMLKQIRIEYLSRVSDKIDKIIPAYARSSYCFDGDRFKEFCYTVGELLREELKHD